MNFKKVFYVFIVVIFVFFLVFLIHNGTSKNIFETQQNKNIQYIEIAGKKIKAEVVSTPDLQARGLSGRKNLGENDGMLFIFQNSGAYPFWMKDMYFSIDMIWIDENFNVVYIKKNAKPESYPETFAPQKNAKYVLEVLSGFSEKNNLKEGDIVRFLSS